MQSLENLEAHECLIQPDSHAAPDCRVDVKGAWLRKPGGDGRLLRFVSCVLPWTLVVLLVVHKLFGQPRCGANYLYSPAQDVVEFEIRNFELGFNDQLTQYQGEPSQELDERWTNLYQVGIPSLISADLAAKLPNKTIPFPHDKQQRHIMALDVFHQLHCLNMIRMALRPEHYGNNMTLHDRQHGSASEELFGVDHIDHCVDSIRQSLTCNADITALTWHWDPSRRRNVPQVGVSHVCKRFDKLQEWARQHAVHEPFDVLYNSEDHIGDTGR